MAKEPFKSIGLKTIEILLKNKKAQIKPFIAEMVKAGATDIKIQIEINTSPIEKTFPPVVIGKKVFKNSTECGIMKYSHKDESYIVGTCK